MPEMYLVGGAVRDFHLGVESKDLDFAVEARSFYDMKQWLITEWGVEIFLENEEYVTIRGRFRKDWVYREFPDFELAGEACDFVLCRKDGAYSDGRRPDSTEVGTLQDDLARRDFTVNAMALDKNGVLIDPFDGIWALHNRELIAVGNAKDRLSEDALRLYRAVRFGITKGFNLYNPELYAAMRNLAVLDNLKNVSIERVREELTRCFKHDTVKTLQVLDSFPELLDYALDNGIWLMPTTKGA